MKYFLNNEEITQEQARKLIPIEFGQDYTILREMTEQEKKEFYENKIVSLIRKKYNVNQELAILRQRDTKTLEYQEYFDYVEQCKAEAKSEVLNDNNTIN